MKILSISILLWNGTLHPYILSSSFELSSFSFFQRSSAQEILTFVSREVFGRSKIGDRHSVNIFLSINFFFSLSNYLFSIIETIK